MSNASPTNRSLARGWLAAAVTTGFLGTAVVAGALVLERSARDSSAPMPAAATADYGQRLLRETPALMGPGHEDAAMRYTGSHLACASCHLDSGARPGTLSLVETASRYPRPSGRDGGVRDLRDRINGCMVRSMNGRELPRDSVEMIAMESYINHLGQRFAALSASRKSLAEQTAFVEPDRAADPEAGRAVYTQRCEVCHGASGEGLLATGDPSDGYLFPALWGQDSYNDGAGMHRVLTAAAFIKARMPLGQADLTDDQAYDVAAYINSHPRPIMGGLERDYPDLRSKPVDSPYPPYADPFPQERHKYGPFRGIREWYAAEDARATPGIE
jgi:thiosulfate dehydrogenase